MAEASTNLHAPSLDPKVLAWQDAIRPYDDYVFIVAHIGGSDMFKVRPFGGNAPLSDIEDTIKPSVEAMFDDLVW